MQAFIIAPPGSGKSTLFQKLAWLLAKGGIGDVLPIPLDWQRVKTASTRDLLLNAVNEFLPKLSVQHKEEFINILEQRLIEGGAVLLIDNYYDSDTSGTRFSVTIERSIADWKRVIIFGRYNPQSAYIQKFNLYSLTRLSLKEIARFVRAWSSITGYSIVPEKIVSLVLLSQWVENIAVMPLFLNIICLAVGYNQLRVQDRLWPLLDFALARITDVETGDKAEGYLLRRLLAEVAWYSWKNLCFLSPADVHELWYKKYGPTGERLFQLAYKRGLIRSAVNNQQIIFINPVIETALAAEGWLLEIQQSEKRDWATALEQAKGKARMINTIGFLAAQLGQENNLVELEKLLIHICAPSQTDIFGLNWLVAGHCLAGLDQRVQEELERKTKIAGQIRNHLIKLLENPLSMEVINSVKRMLEVIHTEPVFRHLIQYVQDKQQPEVARWFIIQILGKWSREDILEPFRRFALDTKEDINVRVRVIEALGQSRLDGAVPILVKLINDSDVREYVVKALATHNTVAATRALLQTWDLNADGPELFLQLSNPEILPELEQSLLKDAIRDYFTLQAIAAIDNEQAVKILTRFLYYDDEDYFSHAASLLRDMTHPAACDALIEFAEDKKAPASRRAVALTYLPREPGTWDSGRVLNLFLRINDPQKTTEAREIIIGASQALAWSSDINSVIQLERVFREAKGEKRRLITGVIAAKTHLRLVPILHELTRDPDPETRHAAIVGLANFGKTESTELALVELEQALKKRWPIRWLCNLFRFVKDERAVPLLARVIQTAHPGFEHAIEPLGYIGGETATQVLIELWRKCVTYGTDPLLRDIVLCTLCESGQPSGIQVILGATTNPNAVWPESDAFRYLSKVNNPAAVDLLIEALEIPNPDVLTNVTEALNKMAISGNVSENLIPRLIAMATKRENPEGQKAAKEVLISVVAYIGIIQDSESVRSLVKALNNPDNTLVTIGLIGLGKVPDGFVTNLTLKTIQSLLQTDLPPEMFYPAVNTWLALKKSTGIKLLCDLIKQHRITSLPYVTYILETLARPEFLCALLEQRPTTDSPLCKLSLSHNFRVMPDSTVILLDDGRRLPPEEAVNWISD